MSLPITYDFAGVDGTAINGQTTTTGGAVIATTGGWELNANRGYNNSGSFQYASVNAGVSDYVVGCKVVNIGLQVLILIRCNSGFTQYLQVFIESTRVRVFDEGFGLIASATGLSLSSGVVASAACNGTAIDIVANGTTVLSFTSSHGLTNNYVGWGGDASALVDDFTADVFTVTSPTAVLSYATPTAAYLEGTSGSSGTGPYTYQWQRSTAPDSGFSNLSNGSGVSGATTLSLTDGSSGIATGNRYYYQLVVTDSLTATFTSNVQSGGQWKVPAYVLFLGDSVTAGGSGGAPSPVATFETSILKAGGSERNVITVNAAEGGLTAKDWYDATDIGNEVQPRLVAAADAGLLAGTTHAVVTLGINDAGSAETVPQYAANMTGIGEYLISRGFVATIYNKPTGIPQDPMATDRLPKLLDLAASIDGIVNGTDLLMGDELMLYYLQDHRAIELQDDGTSVHPNAIGAASVGEAWAFAWAVAVGDVATGGGVSGSRIFGGF